MAGLRCQVRQWRLQAGWTQQALAARAGVTRQTIAGLEAGRYGPGVEVGLRLAGALSCRVEDLFQLEPAGADGPVRIVGRAGAGAARVALASIGGQTVARTLDGLGALRWRAAAAHGVAEAGQPAIRTFGGGERAVFLAGCDPALGLLAAHAARGRVEALWWHAGNADALGQLARGEVHAAAVHCAAGPGAPLPPAAGFRLGRWRMGWIVAAGNPKGIHGASDLGRPEVRLANREPGSGARTLLDRLLTAEQVQPHAVDGYARAWPGHCQLAEAVALGLADVGLGLEAAAQERGLGFLPVSTEVCDLWLPPAVLADPAVAGLLGTLQGGRFAADLAAFGPYDTQETGQRIA